jgi:hypothetical protein
MAFLAISMRIKNAPASGPWQVAHCPLHTKYRLLKNTSDFLSALNLRVLLPKAASEHLQTLRTYQAQNPTPPPSNAMLTHELSNIGRCMLFLCIPPSSWSVPPLETSAAGWAGFLPRSLPPCNYGEEVLEFQCTTHVGLGSIQ